MSTSFESQPSQSRPYVLKPWRDSSIIAGFLGRVGGFSQGPYASLNLAQNSGDDARAVAANWALIRQIELRHCSGIARVRQVHSARVVLVQNVSDVAGVEADGMVTTNCGVALMILTADCVPVLLYDRSRRIIGALHAGWRGVLNGIIEEGLRVMASVGATVKHLNVALGPSIGPCCFEIDQELALKFASTMSLASDFLSSGQPGKAYLDLRGLIEAQLNVSGVPSHQISKIGPCTRCNSHLFFSRRAVKGGPVGLQGSYIALV